MILDVIVEDKKKRLPEHKKNISEIKMRELAENRTDCISCGAALPKETLYDFYRARHRCCPGCGVVVTDVAVYCPECGTRLSKEMGAKGASG